jgi:branched-subunit amino acid transport protein
VSWLLVFVVAGVVTFATRLSFIALLGRMEVPQVVRRALRFVPPAVLSAIILPELVMRDGAPALSVENARLLAGVVAAAIAWRTRNVLLTIASGMASLWIIQAVLAR